MKNYLAQLFADIAAAHREVSETDIGMWGVEPKHPFGHYCGLTREQFPAPTLLTVAQMEELSLAFRIMMISWDLDAELPVKLPPERTYELLVSVLEKKVVVGVPGIAVLAFCDFEPGTCPFGVEYCGCRECFL